MTESSSSKILEKLSKLQPVKKKKIRIYNISDDDSDSSLPEKNEKKQDKHVIVIDESSNSKSPKKNKNSSNVNISNEAASNDEKLKSLLKLYSHIDKKQIEETLDSTLWDLEKAKSKLDTIRKRHSKDTNHKKKTKRKKLNPKVFDSDDDSDAEVSDSLTGDKEPVLEFFNNALPIEMLLLHNCNQKKVDSIVESRPFSGWKDLVQKLSSNKHLNPRLLNTAQDLLQTRKTITSIMKKCTHLSHKIERAIAAGASAIKEQPKKLDKKLKLTSYQMVGLNWLAVMHKHDVNGILADEMGLGKTVQVIAFLTYLKENNLDSSEGPHVIIVPSSTLENWSNEFKRWSPDMKIVKYYGSQDERKMMRMGWRNGDLEDVDVILTTYNLVTNTPEERKLFKVMPIQYLIFDEGHMLKNMGTLRYKHLKEINSKNRILLTGTPLQNNILELMSLLIFIMPSIFSGKESDVQCLFSKNPKISSNKDDKPYFEEQQIKKAKHIMKPLVLRRLKSEVLTDLPKKSEEIIKCPLRGEQKDMYNMLLAKFSAEAKESNQFDGIGMMMQLRKLANHPLLSLKYYTSDKLQVIAKRLAVEPGYKEKNPDYIFEDLHWFTDYEIHKLSKSFKSIANFGLPLELIPNSGKFHILEKLLLELKNSNHRVLIFSQFIMVLDILEEFLTLKKYRWIRLDGSTPVIERQNLIDQFSNDTDIFIFLLSTRAGGLGINLTAADTVIIHDIDFNPYNDKQAEDRCHRVGQTKPVRIIRFISEGTLEEEMYQIAQEKLNLEQRITNDEETESTSKTGVLKLLKETLGLEHNKSINLTPLKNGVNKSRNSITDEEM